METGADPSPFRVKPQLLKRSTGSLANWVAVRGVVRLLGSLPSEMLGGKEHCGAWHRKPRSTGVSGDLLLENRKARSPGQRGSTTQNAVALLVDRAGLEQQRNTKGKVSRRKHRTHPRPGFVLRNQAGARTSPPQPAALGTPPFPRHRLDLTAQDALCPNPTLRVD